MYVKDLQRQETQRGISTKGFAKGERILLGKDYEYDYGGIQICIIAVYITN